MDRYKLILPISILMGCIILGGFYYAGQVNKQLSVERQQQKDLEAKQNELQIKIEQERADKEVAAEKERAEREDRIRLSMIENETQKCNNMLSGLKAKANNIIGIAYSEYEGTCMVSYTNSKTGGIEEGRIEDMKKVEN